MPKASPESVARDIFDGVENGEEEIFPDPMSASIAESWRSGAAKALEQRSWQRTSSHKHMDALRKGTLR